MAEKLLILGNGISRLNYKEFIQNWKHDMWVCNLAFKEHEDFPKIDIVGSVHSWCAIEAFEFKQKNELKYEVYYMEDIEGYENKILKFENYCGWSTGSELFNKACNDGYEDIYLLGFDSLNNKKEDIYTGEVVIVNFQKQIEKIIIKYGLHCEKIDENIFLFRNDRR